VRVADTTHFAYEDGTPYIPVGTTCYVWNLQGDELEERTLRTLEKAPFNKMRMSVFPKRYAFNDNEPPSYPFPGKITRPWRPSLMQEYRNQEPPKFWDFSQFIPGYFQHLEKRILDLRVRGIEADLILFHPYDFGAWGFDRMPPEVNDHLLKYLVARLSAFRNLWWSFANEYDLFVGRKMEDWDHYFQLVQALDPYNHLRSIHNCFAFYDHTKPWVTHCSIQHANLELVGPWLKKYNKPVVVDECGYEGDIYMMWGDLSPEEMLLRFWVGFTNGGYVGHGETYMNPQDLLWWAKGGDLIGESVARIAFVRKLFEQTPRLSPILKIDPSTVSSLEEAFSRRQEAAKVIMEGAWNMVAGGHHKQDFFLFYYGVHQPSLRNFSLPEGSYRIDVIDTWNMTVETWAEGVSGKVSVALPGRKFMAIRIQKKG
jgi:3',5'-cyclic AMP phosphodiesterase CpdA